MFYLSDKKKTRRVQYQRCHTYVGVCQEVCSGKLCKDLRVSEEKHSESSARRLSFVILRRAVSVESVLMDYHCHIQMHPYVNV